MMSHMGGGLSPYESMKLSEMSSRRPNGGTVTAIVLGGVGLALSIGSWVFGPVIAASRSKGIEKLVDVSNANTNNTLNRLATLLDSERAERVAQGLTITQTITDTVSGSQQGTLSAQQAAELSSIQNVMQQTYSDFVTGRASLNPTPVSIYSAPQPCGCPGCNG